MRMEAHDHDTRTILVAGQDRLYVKALAQTLEAYHHAVRTAHDGPAARALLDRGGIDLLLVEENMAPESGREILQYAHGLDPDLPVVLITDFGTIERAVQAMRDGAADYLVKPIDTAFLLDLVKRLTRSVARPDADIVAEDPRSRELLRLARKVAAKDVSVLISGESGTGKEVLARFIHDHSARREHPFVAINCAAIPENMLEAVLFGHEKGAFTGAHQANPGKFEQAQGGTLLLDEISEMALALQAKLLRVLQEREVERLGGHRLIPLDVRVLATTNRNLREEVKAGRFREDLYYRLNVFPLEVAPLRERRGDILPLARHLIQRHSPVGQPLPELSAEAAERLQAYPWPGNVRELGNVIQRALVLCNGGEIRPDDLHFESDVAEPVARRGVTLDNGKLSSDLRSHEYELIVKALQAGNGNRKKAAETLGISPRTLRYKLAKMRKQGLDIPVN